MSTFTKGYEVIPATPGADKKTYNVGGKELSFKGQGMMVVKDSGVAKELEAMHGGMRNSEGDELRVIPVGDIRSDPTGVHKYSFSMYAMGNWKSRIDWSK